MFCLGRKASNGVTIDRRTLDRRPLRGIEKGLDGGSLGPGESVLDGSALRSGECVKPEEGSDPSGLRGNGREMGASSLGRRGLGSVEDLGVEGPNNERRRLR